jgi:RNA ligase
VGSREDLLWCTNDLIHNPAQEIVETVRELAIALRDHEFSDAIVALYGEVYGHKVGAAAKQYTKTEQTDFRLFDVCRVSKEALTQLMVQPLENLAAWRESGHQPFDGVDELDVLSGEPGIRRVPSRGSFPADQIPTDLAATKVFLNQFARSAACLDDTGLGEAEGIILRSKDRRQIAKLRFEDYRRSVTQ